MKKLTAKLINKILVSFKIKDNRILFQSGRNKIDCAPYEIYKYIKKNCPNDYETVWVVEKNTNVSMLQKGDYYYWNTIKGIYYMATSKYWIRSQSLGGVVKKKNSQTYIQLFHGAGAFKKVGYDIKGEKNKETMEHARDWDFLVATDEYNKAALVSAMALKIPTLVLGDATTDVLVNFSETLKNNIIKKIGLDTSKKTILYAPTFRDYELEKEKLSLPIMQLGKLNNTQVLLRLHPLVSNKISGVKLPENFINVGNYPNIEELFLISDVLVTDYSSIIFPFAVLNKTLVFYPYDLKKYEKDRGSFYLNYNDLPGPICYKESELFKTLENIDEIKNKYKKEIKEFNLKYNKLNDGHVCERFVSELKKGTFEK